MLVSEAMLVIELSKVEEEKGEIIEREREREREMKQVHKA